MAAVLLNLVFSKQVTADQLVSWLLGSSNKVDVPEPLRALDKLRSEFVPFLLNFLRDQSLQLIQNGQPTGQTPIKLSEKISNEKEKRRSTQCCSRVELFPTPDAANLRLSPTSTVSPASNPGSIIQSGSGHRNFRKHHNLSTLEVSPNSPQLRSEPRSQQKLSLGQFIVTPSNHRKKMSPISRKDTPDNCSSPKLLDMNPNLSLEVKMDRNEPNVINLSDMQDFPPVGASLSTNKKGQRRRITPTAVRPEQISSSHKFISSDVKSETSSVFNSVFSPVENDSRNTGHTFMRDEQDRAMVLSLAAANCLSDGSMTGASKQCSSLDVTLAEPGLITLRSELDSLIVIYAAFLDGCLVPNLCVELYFLIQLLTVRGHIPESEPTSYSENGEEISYLGTVHNCVYFAVQSLQRQQRVIELLDKGTLRLLADNPRIEKFCPGLRKYLAAKSVNLHSKTGITIDLSIGSVPFQTDTDNRNNFPSDQAFRVFRKQRDLFYELLREWEANHMSPTWTMASRLGNRIHSVVTMWTDPVVYSHFARLFMSQLIAMCKGNTQSSQDNTLADDDFLVDLRKSNPEKFKRLQERFVTPRRIGGPAPLPSFPGAQDFFREFIILAGCPKFNQHLTDCLLFKLLELNGTNFTLPEKEMQDNVDSTLQQHFTSTLLTVRVLGKFLGYVLFLPYQNAQRLPEDILADQIQTRNKVRLALDIYQVLQNAVMTQRTLLTIPWVVELLSMMDCVAPLLDDLNRGLVLLVEVYRSILPRSLESFSLNKLFLLFLIGWLFETPNFPASLIFSKENNAMYNGCVSCTEVCTVEGSTDRMPLIDHHLLYVCCPYLGELKVVLNEFASGTRSRSNAIKKITPIAANDVNNSNISSRKLELQLEENFFHNQQSSVRKTVEFVSERMTSNIIKQMRRTTIPTIRKAAEADLNLYLCSSPNQQKSSAVLKEIQKLSTVKCNDVRKAAEEFSFKYCEERLGSAISLLLAEEMAEAVVTTCCKIAFRQTQESVLQWVTRHITNNLFVDDLRTEWARFKSTQLCKGKLLKSSPTSAPEENDSAKSYACISCTDVTVDLKACTRNLYSYGEAVDVHELNKLLDNVETALKPSQELTTTLQKGLGQLSLELLTGLVILTPVLVSDSCIARFIQIWKQSSNKDQLPAPQIICSRNLLLLQSIPHWEGNWLRLEDLLVHLLIHEVLTVQDLKDQCIKVLKIRNSRGFLERLSECLKSIASRSESMVSPEAKAVELLALNQTVEELISTLLPTLDG